jgi:hypothetical protein
MHLGSIEPDKLQKYKHKHNRKLMRLGQKKGTLKYRTVTKKTGNPAVKLI